MAALSVFWQTPVVVFRPLLVLTLGACALVACEPAPATVSPIGGASSEPAQSVDARAILDALENNIETGTATEADREQAYDTVVSSADDGSADYAFARAALAGRVAELRGVGAGKLVTEAESFARLALDREPEYDAGAATRMLGTLYVMAPGRLVEHGDAEDGLGLLEDLVEARPDDPRNHLRVAEAYIALDDPDPASTFLCFAHAHRDGLRRDDQRLLDMLSETFGGKAGLGCG
ncbi:MAG: tetratricopeptide repeat protein [Nannocystaceae bacterium]|nr:tetratricopeptide repeat protein [Nannocystaceae bacterium]